MIVKVLYRYCDSALFGGFEDIGSIKRVESDLSNPTVMVYESSKFLGENLNLEAMKKMAKCTKKDHCIDFDDDQDSGMVRQQEHLGKSLATEL